MKKFCECLKKHSGRIIGFKKNKTKLLTNQWQESYEKANINYICSEKFENKWAKDKKYCEVLDHSHYIGEYRGAVHSISDFKYSIPKEITIIFHNGSNYDYHFIIKQAAEEFK